MLLDQVARKVNVMQLSNFLLLLFALLVILCRCDARSRIDGRSKLVDNGETLVSAGGKFEMGFFSDDAGLNRYVGIWYKLSPRTVVWVANCNDPIPATRIMHEDNSVVVVQDGNLIVWNSVIVKTYFSTGLDGNSSSSAELLDTGNLVLVDKSGGKTWQSFRYPTDTFLPGMKMERDLVLTSWMGSGSGDGKYKFQVDQSDNKKYVIVENEQSRIHWKASVSVRGSAKSTTFEPFKFSTMPPYVTHFLSNNSVDVRRTSFNNIRKNRTDFSRYANHSSEDSIFEGTIRLLMNSSGEIQFYSWNNESGWSLLWSAPKDICSVYRKCGKCEVCGKILGAKLPHWI